MSDLVDQVIDKLLATNEPADDELAVDTHDDPLSRGELPDAREMIVDRSGARQAGTAFDPHSDFVANFKRLCEQSLYAFTKGVWRMDRLTDHLHKPTCEWLQRPFPKRKCLLYPRDHLKTTICGQGLPGHMLIQPMTDNVYFPGCQNTTCKGHRRDTGVTCERADHRFDGRNTRILLAYETASLAEVRLRWLETQWESNALLRTLWPEHVWENPRAQSKAWNAKQMLINRTREYTEPSIHTAGVDGAVTGLHFNAHIFDDLVSFAAANSSLEMHSTIKWFITSRALMDDPEASLEFTLGTRWAVHDLYSYIMQHEPTVQVLKRAVIENGKPIWPEMFTPEVIEEKRKRYKEMFFLLFMNSAADASLTDFDMDKVRTYALDKNTLTFWRRPTIDDDLESAMAPHEEPGVNPVLPRSMDPDAALEYVRDTYGERAARAMQAGRVRP